MPSNTAIFKNASTTYYYSSLFFPKKVRQDVSTLYAFVRRADDYVDATPQKTNEFRNFVESYRQQARVHVSREDWRIIKGMHQLQQKYQISKETVEAFLAAMAADLTKKRYQNLTEICHYMYGSAEVIGVMLAAILDLPPQSLPAAQLQGRAMQYINFLRDITEDISLGRQYLPTEILQQHGLKSLSRPQTAAERTAFESLVRSEIARYRDWQAEAEAGYHFLPYRYRVPVATAAALYNWTARQIDRNPMEIFVRKIKPSKWRVLLMGLSLSLLMAPGMFAFQRSLNRVVSKIVSSDMRHGGRVSLHHSSPSEGRNDS